MLITLGQTADEVFLIRLNVVGPLPKLSRESAQDLIR